MILRLAMVVLLATPLGSAELDAARAVEAQALVQVEAATQRWNEAESAALAAKQAGAGVDLDDALAKARAAAIARSDALRTLERARRRVAVVLAERRRDAATAFSTARDAALNCTANCEPLLSRYLAAAAALDEPASQAGETDDERPPDLVPLTPSTADDEVDRQEKALLLQDLALRLDAKVAELAAQEQRMSDEARTAVRLIEAVESRAALRLSPSEADRAQVRELERRRAQFLAEAARANRRRVNLQSWATRTKALIRGGQP